MRSIQFTILPPPEILKNDVECVRIAEYSGEEALSIKVSPNGLPGIVFHQNNGQAALEHIITHSERRVCPPMRESRGVDPKQCFEGVRLENHLHRGKCSSFVCHDTWLYHWSIEK